MPTITFDPSRNSSPTALIDFIEAISADPNVVSLTSTRVELSVGNLTFVLTGTGFAATPFGFTGNDITGISADLDGMPFMEGTNFGLTVSELTSAIFSEMFGSVSALETLFCALDYTYFGNANADVFLRGTLSEDGVEINFRGADTFRLGAGADRVFSGDGNDTVYGDSGKDAIWGGAGRDKLFGGVGNDTLRGESSGDVLVGGAGSDFMVGGTGGDRFVFNFTTDSPHNLARDKIYDFGDGADLIDLRPLGAVGVVLDFIDNDPFSGTKAEVRYLQSSGLVIADTDGNGSGDFSILLMNKPVLDATDFLL